MTVLNRNPILKKTRINERHGADIASAATVNLSMATGNLVDITGTTTITAITLPDGAERVVRFTGALTLTHGASLVLPGSANITTAAGDFATFRGYASGVVRCVSYNKISGHPVLPVGMNLLSSVTASASSTIDLETTFNSTYDYYMIVADGVRVSTDGANILMRAKVGGAYDTGTNYDHHSSQSLSSTSTYSGSAATAQSSILIANSVGNAAARSASFIVDIYHPASTSLQKQFSWRGISTSTGGNARTAFGAGANTSTAALTGIRFYPSAGNLSVGNFRLYGVKK